MKIKNNIYLLILNIIHTLMCVGIMFITVFVSRQSSGGMLAGLFVILIIILAIIGMWLLYCLPSPKAAVILLRIKSIFKLIFIVCLSFVVMIILLAAIDCSHSLSGNENGAPLTEKLPVIIPFVSIIVLSIFYMVIYQILLSYISKRKINKPMMIIAFIFNVGLCLLGILYMLSTILKFAGSDPFIDISIIDESFPIMNIILIAVLVLYISFKAFTSVLLMKNVVRKQ